VTAKTVTFAVQLGSGGFSIARAVAEKLSYRYYDSEVTARAASDAGVPAATILETQQAQSLLERLIARLGAAGMANTELAAPSAAGMDLAIHNLHSEHYRHFIEHVVKELADQGGSIIVGHAGQIVLQDEWSVLKVLIIGSAARRTQRLANEEQLTLEEAQKLIEQSDRERAEFFRRVYRSDLGKASLYDLCLNTDTIPFDAIIELIVGAASSLPGFVREPMEPDAGEALESSATEAN
jgi:cytidylate kinase